MQNNKEVLRRLFVYTNIAMLLSVLCGIFPFVLELVGLNDLPVLKICLAIMVLVLVVAGMAVFLSFKAQKIPADEQKYLYKLHQMPGRNIFALCALASIISLSCVYFLHFDAFVVLQVALLLPFSIGVLNLRSALRMKTA